ncbi:hypothetical protein CDL15_Pgr001733 [Punica granatum]|uniref:Fe2OG dioxygenase domain-containing protein n=1 Tax=Punica granatum TaxID=22663 RepID=A0A218XBT9_PUNGR|nr:hypothetical protein CDL15_Pgr001733 [Punica granatum]
MDKDPGVAEVVRQLDRACREAGFFYVKGHGIPDSLIREVRTVSHKFFGLPYEEKVKIKLTPAAGYRGYQRVGENITKGVPDMHEAIDFYREVKQGMYRDLGRTMEGCNLWPCDPPNMKTLMEEYIDRCTGILTLVNQDDGITALQVKNSSGEWISAPPVPGTFVCNIGDMLKIWSNGVYDSTLHRVINNSPKYRVCVAFFYEPNFDVGVEPLDFCVKRTGGAKKFERAVYGEHLVTKVTTNFVM